MRDGPVEHLDQPLGTALYALVAIANRLGRDTTVEDLRRTYAFRDKEPSTSLLVAIARDLGLEAKAATVSWRNLPRFQGVLPAIIRMREGSACILERIEDDPAKGTVALLRDPSSSADSLVLVDKRQLTQVWDGEIILVKRQYGVTDKDRPFDLSWLLGQIVREKRIFADIGLAAFVGAVFAIAPPFIFMLVIDRVLTNNSISTLYVITGALALMIVCEMILGYIRRLFAEAAMTRVDGRLNLLIGERLFKLPLEYFETNPTGAITSKLGQMWRIRSFLVNELFGVTIEAIPMLLILPIMIMLSWQLTLWVLAMATAVFVIVVVFIEPLGRLVQKVIAAEHKKGAHLSESIYGIKTVKSLALEGRRRYEWDALVAEGETTKYNLGVLANYPQTMALPFERLIYSGSFLLGAYTIVSTQLSIASGVSPQTLSPGSPGNISANVVNIISPGSLIAFAMLSMRLANPLLQMAHLIQQFVEVRGAIGQVGQVLNASKEKGHFGTGLRLPIEGEITFDNVRFRYSPTAAFALDGVSFKVPRGSMIGIMGRSGSGKTTVTRLLQGLNPDYEGIIKVDGMDLREIDLKHLRTNIGVVPQENFLFSGTIRENISIACPSATFAEVVRAAQMAGAEEFIERLPQGYETRLEEGATNLSGGQRQRLAIARALLVNPSVLILDEATSALDAESEAIINSNLARIALGRSIICISHRLSMLVPADLIIVLERGHVYDIGTHDELLQRCDIYSHLWYTQNRHVNRPPHVKLASNRPPEA